MRLVVLPLLASSAAATAPFIWSLGPAGTSAHFSHHWSGGATVALAFASLGLLAGQGIWTLAVDSARTRTLENFNNALGDTIQAFSELVDSNMQTRDRHAFLHTIVKEAKSLLPLESARVCLYLLEARDEERGAEVHLEYFFHAGRNDHPRMRFQPDQPASRAAIETAKGTTDRLVTDIRRPSAHVQCDPNVVYRSFMQVPLRAGGEPWGLLTIDTPTRTRFTSEHRAVARTIARFVEIANDRVAAAARDFSPELSALDDALENQIKQATARQPSRKPGSRGRVTSGERG